MFFNSVNPYNICAFLVSTLLLLAYFSKRRIRSTENKIYDVMVAVSFLGTIISFFTYLVVAGYESFTSSILLLIPKIYLVYLIIWGTAFTLYVINISMNNLITSKCKLLKLILIIISSICAISVFILDMEYVSEGAKIYTTGTSVYLTYLLAVVYACIIIFFVIKNIKNIIDKRYTPILTFIILLVAIMFLQYKNPELLVITFIISFNTLLMYFTIENPDVLLLAEYKKAKEQSDLMNEEKEEFILDIAKEIKMPLTQIKSISKHNITENNIDIIKEGCSNITILSGNALNVVDNALNITNIDKNKFKATKSTYDPNRLFKELEVSYSNIIKKKSGIIEFRCDFNSILPLLYGDNYQLKTILKTILDNSVKYTKEGYIELKVDNIIRKDVCRLYISVSDSGSGIDNSKIKDILDKNRIYKFGEFDENAQNLASCKTLLKTMGGTLLVNSASDYGTEVKIILDQMIVENKNKKIQKIDYNAEKYIDKCKISLNTGDLEIQEKIKKLLNKDEYLIDDSKHLFGQLRKKEKFDVIIIDEKKDIYEGLDMLKKVRAISNIPIVLIKRNINFSKDEDYIKYGFDGIIDPSQLNNLEEIIYRLTKENDIINT